MTVFAFVVVYNHTWQLHCTCMRNKYPCKREMSTYNCYKSRWRWSVSQFSTCIRLSRHGCQRHNFWNSQTDSQMHTFLDQMNSQFVQIFMESKFQSKLRVLDKNDVKQKTSLFSVQGKSSWCLFFCFPSSVSTRQFE